MTDPRGADAATRNERKDRDLRRTRWMATGLLALAALVALGCAVLRAQGLVHPALGYVAAFSEAAMIGALADWFAVVALFRRPLGLPIPHTAILPRNKQRIARGISEFIQVNFLSADAIVAKIAEIGPAGKLRDWLLKHENADRLAALASRLVAYGIGAFDDARVRRFLHAAISAKLKEVDAAALAAQMLDVLTEGRRHHAVLEEVLRLLDEAIASPETRAHIARAVVEQSRLVDFAKKFGFDLDETIAQKIVRGAAQTIEEVRRDPQHALRLRFDDFVAGYVERLKGDEATRAKVHQLRDELLGNPALEGYLGGLWQDFRAWLARDLADRDSKVHGAIREMALALGRKLDEDPEIQRWVDEQILKALPVLVEENRARIGRFIEERINDWHEDRFVAELERELGRDLQFIRINGALVGGIAGLAIYAIARALE